MFGTLAGGENQGPGRPEKNWAQCLAEYQGIPSDRRVQGYLLFAVRSRDGVMAEGG